MKKLLNRYKILLIILAIPYFFIVISGIVKVNYDVTSPGGLNKVESIIEVENGKVPDGSFNTVSVYSVERVPLLTYLIGKIDNIASVDKTSEYIQLTPSQTYSSGTIQKKVSINNAIILAYRLANKQIGTAYHGLIVHTVFNNLPYDVQIGDIITAYNGEAVSNEAKFTNTLIADVREEKTIILTILRDNKTFEVEYQPMWTEDYKSFYTGIFYYDYYTIIKEKTDPQFTINHVNTLGPSGGLMQALSIYNAVSDNDLTQGLKIAGTGTIDVNGNVGAIGGIYQKVFTAYYSKADIFFVPVKKDQNGEIIKTEGNNYMEALKAYEKLGSPKSMSFVPVSTLEEAIAYLESIK